MNRREFIATRISATVASSSVPARTVEQELPVMTVKGISAEIAAHTQKMIETEQLRSS